ncbi:glycosyltransferase family 4 protein [Rhodoplanes sp. TEM]|uniref:Glycosyltransferase family 4 protein n=1 Tax=Rhodoplanes tepidamans TaxID=200616 RepID=A0ABT5JFY3_RHOTP|nr:MULTISPECIES: glycosyltransferase family 4 protein [Rhodoplanes]MDC7788619.1 glycosyltransferase family 4 protein [Rhodoplanes tepidamans]MDC7982468.1 glycosyltransferase family 4 protein [Rhodoplanes sp. TEM]MDQ0354960.1 glycosyltransferase involved in cell wall biosynthesis [Rhodoplanes tepidamans]
MPAALGVSHGTRVTGTSEGSTIPARGPDADEPGEREPDAGAAGPSVRPLAVLITVPTLDVGAADEGAIELARILGRAGHRPVVASRGGRFEGEIARLGGVFVRLDATSHNPLVIARNAGRLHRLIREHGCDAVHAHGRASAWSAWAAARASGRPFLTTCYTGFREQNRLKRIYNGVMARADRVIAVSEPIGDLMVERHRVPWARLAIVHPGVDLTGFDPGGIAPDRIAAARKTWGVTPDTRVVLVPGRIIRRRGHHVAVQAAAHLKARGLRDFLFVLAGEDGGTSSFSGELWDQVLASRTADVVRLGGPSADPPACCAAATVVVSAAIQLEGLPRGLLEGMAMARPVVASDLAAGPEAVLSPPTVPEDRMTGLRVPAGDAAALAAALVRMFSYSDHARHAMGQRARAWVLSEFDPEDTAARILSIYADVCGGPARGAATPHPAGPAVDPRQR